MSGVVFLALYLPVNQSDLGNNRGKDGDKFKSYLVANEHIRRIKNTEFTNVFDMIFFGITEDMYAIKYPWQLMHALMQNTYCSLLRNDEFSD